MMSPAIGYPAGLAIVAIVGGLAVVLLRRRGHLLAEDLSPDARREGRRRAGAAIGVGLAAIAVGPGPVRDAAPRSLLAWVGVATAVFLPVAIVGWLGDRWLRRKLGAEGYERLIREGFPARESGARASYVVYGTCVVVVFLVSFMLSLRYVGT